eukprot:UN3128
MKMHLRLRHCYRNGNQVPHPPDLIPAFVSEAPKCFATSPIRTLNSFKETLSLPFSVNACRNTSSATSSPRTSWRSSLETRPSPWMSKKLNSSFMAVSLVIAAGDIVAASQSVYSILSSASGSNASNAALSSASGNKMPWAETATQNSFLDK